MSLKVNKEILDQILEAQMSDWDTDNCYCPMCMGEPPETGSDE